MNVEKEMKRIMKDTADRDPDDTQSAWHAARAVALEEVIAWLRRQAGDLFAEGQDDAAKMVRSHAKLFATWAGRERDAQASYASDESRAALGYAPRAAAPKGSS